MSLTISHEIVLERGTVRVEVETERELQHDRVILGGSIQQIETLLQDAALKLANELETKRSTDV